MVNCYTNIRRKINTCYKNIKYFFRSRNPAKKGLFCNKNKMRIFVTNIENRRYICTTKTKNTMNIYFVTTAKQNGKGTYRIVVAENYFELFRDLYPLRWDDDGKKYTWGSVLSADGKIFWRHVEKSTRENGFAGSENDDQAEIMFDDTIVTADRITDKFLGEVARELHPVKWYEIFFYFKLDDGFELDFSARIFLSATCETSKYNGCWHDEFYLDHSRSVAHLEARLPSNEDAIVTIDPKSFAKIEEMMLYNLTPSNNEEL